MNALQATVFNSKHYMLDAILKANPPQSEIIKMFDFAIENLGNKYTAIKSTINILSHFKMFNLSKEEPEIIKKWLEKILKNIIFVRSCNA